MERYNRRNGVLNMVCNSCNKSLNKLGWSPLSNEYLNSIINQLNSYDNYGIENLAVICTATNKTVGDVVHMGAHPTGGTAPYTVTFRMDSTTIGSVTTGVTEGQTVTRDYTTVSGDVSTTAHAFSVTTTDSCSLGAKTNTESCNVTISAAIVCNTPACNLTVT